MIATLRACILAGAVMTSGASGAEITHQVLKFSELDGWARDDHAAALTVFTRTCGDMDGPDWQPICALARSEHPADARAFFEMFFRPVLVRDGEAGLVTGYFEPELDGALHPGGRFRYPVYRMPPEARSGGPWLTRRQILESGVLQGRGLEIAWVDDPVELFFLQIQGSGRIRLPNGRMLRVGYGGANGHPYRSVGQELVRRGVFSPHQVSAQVIRSWVRRNPGPGADLLYHNPSYVFFRRVENVKEDEGPLGAMNRSITAMRTVAIDPDFTPLGAPVWLEKDGQRPIRRLMVAQDTGSAIKGAQRADLFCGTGDKAGEIAGRLKDPGRLVVLMPIATAYRLVPDGV